jgi:ATPase subunit of ABC transporter with duplicated ATPase domains
MGNQALWDAMQEKERLHAGEMTDEIGMRLAELECTIAEEDGYTAEARAAACWRASASPPSSTWSR